MLRWFGVPEVTIMKVVNNPKNKVYILQEKDINLDSEHPPEEALDSDISVIKKHCNKKAWNKVNDSCKTTFFFYFTLFSFLNQSNRIENSLIAFETMV